MTLRSLLHGADSTSPVFRYPVRTEFVLIAHLSSVQRKFSKAFYQHENYRRVSESLRAGRYTRFDVDSDRIDKGLDFTATSPVSKRNALTVGLDIKEGSVNGKDVYVTSNDRAENRGKLRLVEPGSTTLLA